MSKQYREIEFWGCTIEGAVNMLLEYRDRGILACGTFNGVTLYSDVVTVNGAYLKITGKTKAQFDNAQQGWRDEYAREEKEHKDRIPEVSEVWKSKGREVLSKDRWDYWDKIVPIRLGDLYRGMELKCCLDIVKMLNDGGELDEAKIMIENQGHSGMSFGLVRSMVRELCDRGQEFSDYVR